MDKTKMGEYLTSLRQKAGLTQQEEAELFSVTPQAVSKWELGLSAPDIDTLEKISAHFGVSINEIIAGGKEEPKAEVRQPISERVLKRLSMFISTCMFFLMSLFLYSFPFFEGFVTLSNGQSIHITATAYEFVFRSVSYSTLVWGFTLCLLFSLAIFGFGFGTFFSKRHAKGYRLAQHILIYFDLASFLFLCLPFCFYRFATLLYLLNFTAYIILFYVLPSNRARNLVD